MKHVLQVIKRQEGGAQKEIRRFVIDCVRGAMSLASSESQTFLAGHESLGFLVPLQFALSVLLEGRLWRAFDCFFSASIHFDPLDPLAYAMVADSLWSRARWSEFQQARTAFYTIKNASKIWENSGRFPFFPKHRASFTYRVGVLQDLQHCLFHSTESWVISASTAGRQALISGMSEMREKITSLS